MRAERLTEVITFHGEGPAWWPALDALRCVDMLAGEIVTIAGDGGVERTGVGSSVAAMIRPRRGGGALVAREHDLAIADAEDLTDLRPLAGVLDDPDIRLNEGGCDPQGRCYIGSMAYDKTEGAAALYRYDGTSRAGPDPGRAERVLSGLTTANGLGWSPDGRTAYHNDSPTRVISAFDHDPDRGLVIESRRPFATIPEGVGHPDGLAVDAEGGVWVALFGGSGLRRYDTGGRLTEEVSLPVANVTACTFGGPGLTYLYVTTSRDGLDEAALAEQPAAGSLFVLTPGVAGLPLAAYGG